MTKPPFLIPDVREDANRTNTRVTVRMDDDLLAWFRASGRGWQKRMNDALRWYVQEVEKQQEPPK